MNFDDVIATRHSCRGFRSDPLDPSLVHEIVDVAQRTPSWCNSQAWQLEVTSGEVTRELSEALVAEARALGPGTPDIDWPEKYVGVYQDRRRETGFALYDAVGIAREDREARFEQMLENYRFFGAPHTAIVTSPKELGPYGWIDCGGFVSVFMLAAQSRGVASIAQAAVALYADTVREVLGLSSDRDVVCAISFGWADPDHPANTFRTNREGSAGVVTWHGLD